MCRNDSPYHANLLNIRTAFASSFVLSFLHTWRVQHPATYQAGLPPMRIDKMIPMKTYRLIGLMLIMMLMPVPGWDNGFAMDVSGCLTCHQYPGLTRPETPNGFKVFHIDEESYLQSPHGKTDCIKCHTTITKVPHVSETEVNCTNGCHQEEKDKKLISEYDLKKLHDKEKFYITRLDDGSSCSVCHFLYPHRSSELARAFINMHIGFMACETCHINREKFKSLRYDWANSETADFAGKPFGTRFNPNISDNAKSTHFISRISVFLIENGKQRPLVNTWDTEKARAYLTEEEKLTPEEKEKKLNYFHQDIHKAEISVTCNECHSNNTILDFKQLGFSEKKTNDLIYLNIKGLVTKYKVFYLPHMLEQ
jgi:hypothetical protein